MAYKPKEPLWDQETLIERMAVSGMTWEEMAAVLGFSNTTELYQWFRANPRMRNAAERGRENPNRRVEASLFRRAVGFQAREVISQDGKPTKVIIKDFAPDPISCIFWLKNRDPARWRDVVHHEFSLRDRMDRAAKSLDQGNARKLLSSVSETHEEPTTTGGEEGEA